MARAYSVFANGGFLIQPYFIHKIVDDRGNALALAEPRRAGDEALRVLDPRNAFIMDNMMQDVTRYGTAARAGAARPRRPCRQDRHHQRVRRRLVRRLPARAGRRVLVGFDQPSARTRPAAWLRCRSGSATWSRCCRIPGDVAQRARGHRGRADRSARRRVHQDGAEFFYRGRCRRRVLQPLPPPVPAQPAQPAHPSRRTRLPSWAETAQRQRPRTAPRRCACRARPSRPSGNGTRRCAPPPRSRVRRRAD